MIASWLSVGEGLVTAAAAVANSRVDGDRSHQYGGNWRARVVCP